MTLLLPPLLIPRPSKMSIYLNLPMYSPSNLLTGIVGRGGRRSQIIRQRESLVLYNPLITVCYLIRYGFRSPKFIWAPCHVMRTAVLIGRDLPRNPPPPPHLDSYTRALLVNKYRRHLLVTPWLPWFESL
jgi:hypothetical protein